jgi:hypothetical protein
MFDFLMWPGIADRYNPFLLEFSGKRLIRPRSTASECSPRLSAEQLHTLIGLDQ